MKPQAARPLIFLALLFTFSGPSELDAQDCVDYGQAMHWISSLSITFARDVAVDGSYAYVVRGYRPGTRTNGLVKVDISNPFAPVQVASLDLANPVVAVAVHEQHAYLGMVTGNVIGIDVTSTLHQAGAVDVPGNPNDIVTAGGYAYVAVGDSGLAILDLAIPEGPVLTGWIDTPGYAQGVVVEGTRAYVADGYSGIEIIDVSSPRAPALIGSADTHFIARDVAVVGDLLAVADDRGVTLIDVSDPSAPELMGHGLTVGPSRAVAMDERFAYVAQGAPGGLDIFDLTDPLAPIRVSTFTPPGIGNAVVLRDSMVFCVEGIGVGGLHIFDVTPPAPPPPIGRIDIDWSSALKVVGSQALVGTDSRLLAVDLSVISAPLVVDVAPLWLPATDLAIAGTYAVVSEGAYVLPRGKADAGEGGLQIFDISEPDALAHVAFLGALSYAGGVEVDSTFAYVADSVAGLVVVDLHDPRNPHVVGGYDLPGSSSDVAVADGLAVLVGEGHPLVVIDISNPTTPQPKGTVSLSGKAVAISGDLACVAGEGLATVDLSDPEHPRILGSAVLPPASNLDIAISDEIAYIAGDGFGVLAFDLTNPEAPHLMGGIPVPYGGHAVTVDEHWVYTAGGLEVAIYPHQCRRLDPVDFGGLEAVAVDEGIKLHWQSNANVFIRFWVDRALGREASGSEFGLLNPDRPVPGKGPWEFLDKQVSSDRSYCYKIRGERRDGGEETIGPVVATAASPAPQAALLRAVPNPSSNEVSLHFQLSRRTAVQLEIYDATGHLVRRMQAGGMAAGPQTMIWDGRNGGGQPVASGRYVARVSWSGGTASTGIVLLRD